MIPNSSSSTKPTKQSRGIPVATEDTAHTWYRFYNGTLDDRNLRRIAAETGLQRVTVLGAWAGLMTLAAADYRAGGKI